MVRVYLKHRFTKKNCSTRVTEQAIDYFGGFHTFGRAKVLHSVAAWLNKEVLYPININGKNP